LSLNEVEQELAEGVFKGAILEHFWEAMLNISHYLVIYPSFFAKPPIR
jgi:hypothetical protein